MLADEQIQRSLFIGDLGRALQLANAFLHLLVFDQQKALVDEIFGNTLEALVGAIYLDRGYKKTAKWVTERIILPHMFIDDLELDREIIHIFIVYVIT